MVKAYEQGYSQHMIAKVLGVSQQAVFAVIKRSRKWVVVVTWHLVSLFHAIFSEIALIGW